MTPPYMIVCTDIDKTELESDFGSLVFRAYSVLAHAISQRTQHDLNVTAAQGRLLYLVEMHGLSHAAEISRECYVDPTAVTRLINRLVRDGLLTRTQSTVDRRVFRLVPTPQGQRVAGGMPAIFSDVYNDLLAGFSAEEVASFKEMLLRMLSC
jgi:DNA-binding MarR family transcriptional regulator